MEPDALRKLAVPVLVIVLLSLAATGVFLMVWSPSAQDQVRYALDDLVAAVEGRDPELLASRIHPEYQGWGRSYDNVVGAFRVAIDRYQRADIDLREVDVEVEGDSAMVTLEWTAGARFQTELYRVDTTLKKPPYETATLEFRRADGDRWLLSDLRTILPHPEP